MIIDWFVGDRTLAKKQRLNWRRIFMLLLFWIYMGAMIYFLFIGERYGNPYHDYRYNLVVFQEIRRFITYRESVGTISFLLNIIGNIFAFSPFGFFLPEISPKMRNFWKVLSMSFLVTMCIECTQLVTKLGVFDVDDLIMNTLGGVIGYGLYCIARKLYRNFGKKHS